MEEEKGVEGEEAEETPKDTKAKKRKDKEKGQPQHKPSIPITRSRTRATIV